MCDSDKPTYYEDSSQSDVCVNTRDGNSMYYDCSKAHLAQAELSQGTPTKTLSSTIYYCSIAIVLGWCSSLYHM